MTLTSESVDVDLVWNDFKAHLKSRSLTPPADPNELGADFTEFIRQQYPQPKSGRRRTIAPADTSATVPRKLKRRQGHWLKAQLQRIEEPVAAMREALGFDDTPFPGDQELADAFIVWASDAASGPRGSTGIYHSVDRLNDSRLKDALRELNPPVYLRSKKFDEDQTQLVAFENAIERLVHECEFLSRTLGTDIQSMAKWVLAGIEPKGVCINARLNRRSRAPDIITMKINVNVVTPEEVRTVYRQLARIANRPADKLIQRFHSLLEGNMGRSVRERLALWNERYPLRQYGNEETFRVVTSRALKKTGRTLSGSARATR